MKRKILIIIILLFTTGCVYTKDASIEEIADASINSKYKIYNHVNKGYKLYLPSCLRIKKIDAKNEIIQSKKYDYYLYVDLISYYNKVDIDLPKSGNYYNLEISKKNKKGIINVLEKENLYIVKIVYNYATIEVKSNKEDLNEVINNGLIIVSSIVYNDEVIESLMGNENFLSSEEQIHLFDHESKDDALGVDDTYIDDDTIYDPDILN